MNKWQLARYLIDAKKDIDNILFISQNVSKLRNLDLRRIINYKLSEFYINLCVIYDKSLDKGKSKFKKDDEIIEATYYQRDKNYAHKDENYNRENIEFEKIIITLKEQLEHCFKICGQSLPNEITIDYVAYDRDLYRFINKIDYETEEQIKIIKHPHYNDNSGVLMKPINIFHDTEDVNILEKDKDYGVIIENGLCVEEGLQNRQDFCIKVNVLYNLNFWATLNNK